MVKRSHRKFAISTSRFLFFDFSIFFANAWRRAAKKDNAKPTRKRWAVSREARVLLSLRRESNTATIRWPLFHSDEPAGSYDFLDSVSTKCKNQHRMRPIELITRKRSDSGRPISTSNANQRYDKTESPQMHHFEFPIFAFSIFLYVLLTHGGGRRRRITLRCRGSGGPLLERRAFAFLYAGSNPATSRRPHSHPAEPGGILTISGILSRRSTKKPTPDATHRKDNATPSGATYINI